MLVTKPTGLNTSPTKNECPLLATSKSETIQEVDPIPVALSVGETATVINWPVPVSVVFPIPLLETPVISRFW